MRLKFIWYCILYKSVISKDDFIKLSDSISKAISNIMLQTANDIDRNKDGLISVGEILYLMSKVFKSVRKLIKGIK